MNNVIDDRTKDLFGDAEPRSADVRAIHQHIEQSACVRVNSANSEYLQDKQVQQQAEQFALKCASKAMKLGYEPKALFCYTDANGQPVYFKARNEHLSFYDLSLDEQNRIASEAKANKHKWIRAISLNPNGGKWQAKEPDYAVVYPDGNGQKPLYRLHKLMQAEPDQIVYLFEGEQKADLAASLGLVATTCGGSNSISATHLEPLAGRKVVIWADNDEAGIKARDELTTLLQAIGCTVLVIDVDALGLPEKGDIVDWVDLRAQDGIETTKADIESLSTIAAELEVVIDEPLHSVDKLILDDGTYIENTSNGLYHISTDVEGEVRALYISQPLHVLGEARDAASTNWKKALRFKDKDNKEHTVLIPYENFIGEATEALRLVANHGLTPPNGSKRKNLLLNYITSYPTDKRFTCVDRAGWYNDSFVLPHKVFGSEDILYSGEAKNPYSTSGTLEKWQELSQLIEPHSLAVLCFSSAFAGQLVEKIGAESGGFHIHGSSTDGKSTIAVAACSVWGNPNKYRLTWRTTDNAAENNAEIRNDSFAVFDELKQATAKAVDAMLYMLTAGDGKDRASRSAKNRDTKFWNLIYVSTGEISIDVHLNRGGIEADAGQVLRFVHIPSDAGCGMGVFETLNYGKSVKDLAERITEISRSNYGLAGEAWLTYLQANIEQATSQAKVFIDEFMQRFANDCNNQAQRVGRRFALAAAAGELANEVGITHWQKGRAIEAVGQCFNKWLASFGDGMNLEQIKILAQVRSFFEAHGSSRFENLDPLLNNFGDELPQRINNRVGYFRNDGSGKTYFVSTGQFKTEICKGSDPRQVAKVLKEAGWLECDYNKSTKAVRLPDSPKVVRAYVFNSAMWQWDNEQNTETAENEGNKGNIGNNTGNKGFDDVTHSENEKVTKVTEKVTTLADSQNNQHVTPVTYCENEKVTGSTPNEIRHVTHVTSEKQGIEIPKTGKALI